MIRCFSLICALMLVLGVNTANADLSHRFKIYSKVIEYYQNAIEVAQVFDYLWRTGPDIDEEIEQRSRAAKNYHPMAHVRPPKIDADQAFSRFPYVRDGVRSEWANFVQNEESEIQRLEQRRQQQRGVAARYERRLREIERAKDVFWKLSRNPTLYAVGQYEYAKKAAELEGMLPPLSDLVAEHKRILKDFDSLISRKQNEAAFHRSIQGMLEHTRNLPTYLDPSEVPSERATPSADGSAALGTKGRTLVEQRIEGAVDSVGYPLLSKAEQARNEADERYRRMTRRNDAIAAGERPGLTSGGGAAGGRFSGADTRFNDGSNNAGGGVGQTPDTTFTITVPTLSKGKP